MLPTFELGDKMLPVLKTARIFISTQLFFERLRNVNGSAFTKIGYGFFVDSDQNPTVNKPLLFFNESTLCQGIQMLDGQSAGNPATITTYNRPSNVKSGTQSVVIAINASESSAVSFKYLNPTNFADVTVSVSPNSSTTINPIVTGSLQRTSAVTNEANITTTFTTVTAGQTLHFRR